MPERLGMKELAVYTLRRVGGEFGSAVQLFGLDLAMWIYIPGSKMPNRNLISRTSVDIASKIDAGEKPFLAERLWLKLAIPSYRLASAIVGKGTD